MIFIIKGVKISRIAVRSHPVSPLEAGFELSLSSVLMHSEIVSAEADSIFPC